MSLTTGQTLSFYEILGPLGAGGMGEVYRARDTKLDREVAIKVLPAHFADDEDRLRRFEREAKTLASLNHPNIAGIHGVDQVDDVCFLALELVPGEDLAQRLSRGALPVDEALDVCCQIAEGLEAAHEAGVIHRDLKPANMRITPEGVVKLLDFGLAKPTGPAAMGGGSTGAEPDSALMTEEGVILGTPVYMSPEQARGRPVDRRTDIWAFGCVLFECLTGERAFSGGSFSDLMAAILGSEPDWELLPDETPQRVRELLRRTAIKDPRQRLRDMGDARLELDAANSELLGSSLPPTAHTPAGGARTGWVVAALAGALALALGARELLREEPTLTLRQPTRFVLAQELAPKSIWLGKTLAISPDGSTIAFTGAPGDTRLFLRPIDAFEATPVPGSEGARCPFFSPDGQLVAFWSSGWLLKTPSTGGPVTRIAEISPISTAAWGADDQIVVCKTVSALFLVDGQSGESRPLTEVGDSMFHRSPSFLPGGTTALFEDDSSLVLFDLPDGKVTDLGIAGEHPRWSATGHIIYQRKDQYLMALPFDLETRSALGPPIPATPEPVLEFDLARDGTLVYMPGHAYPEGDLVWVDRSGAATALGFEVKQYFAPRISPDEAQVVVSIVEAVGGKGDLWNLDLQRRARTRMTTDGRWNAWPVWTHDASRIAFLHGGELEWMSADQTGDLYPFDGRQGTNVPISWNQELAALAFYSYNNSGDLEIWHADQEEYEVFLATSFDERSPHFSPDGRWIAYVTNQSGRDEVLVRAYTRGQPAGAPLAISSAGGVAPVWSRDGTELTYRKDGALFAVSFQSDDPPTIGAPELLFDEPYLVSPVGRGNPNYDVASDGRFLMIRPTGETLATRVHVVRDWSIP